MGIHSSKHAQKQGAKDNWNLSLPRTTSLPVYGRAEKGKIRSADIVNRFRIFVEEETDDSSSRLVFHSKQISSAMKLKPLKEEEECKFCEIRDNETVDSLALMEGQDENPNPKRTRSSFRPKTWRRSLSSVTAEEVDSSLANSDSPKFAKFRKHLQQAVEMPKPSNESLVTPAISRFNLFSPSGKWNRSGSEGQHFSVSDTVDVRSPGLKSLLSPSTPLSPTNSSTIGSTLVRKPSLNRHTALSFNHIPDSLSNSSIPQSRNSEVPPSPVWATSDSASKGPVFDPVFIAAFEQVVESTCENNWDWASGISASSLSCSETTTSSETSSDADSAYLATAQLEEPACKQTARQNKLFSSVSQEKYPRKLPFSKAFLVSKETFHRKDLESLENYELKCPPGGENKVVLYFTSLHAVRKTFEDCEGLRLILRGLMMHVDERDVWMHSKFKQEVEDLLGKGLIVPRLFIRGRYIGGIEEVTRLHEDGILIQLLKGLQTENVLKVCNGCGDMRFIPCLTCNGSCKLLAEDNEVVQCLDCNENGLMLCPLCGT